MSENSSHLSSEADPLRFDLPPESIGPVFQLPEQVRSKWQTWECAGSGGGNSGEVPDLRKKEPEGPQQDTEQSSMEDYCTSTHKGMERSPKWEERLAIAETNRQLTLEEKRLKASTVKHRANEVVERVTDRLSAVAKRTDVALQAAEERRTALNTERAERLSARGTHLNEQRERLAHMMELRYRELGEQLHARLEQADALREAQLAETAGRASEVVAKARRRQAEQRQRDLHEAQNKLAQLEARLNRAALSRQAQRPIPQLAGQKNLAQRSVEVARLRRHHSARKLQRAWRSFAAASMTTRQFAAAFVRTGLPGISVDSLVNVSRGGDSASGSFTKATLPPHTPVTSPIPKRSISIPDSPGFAIIGLGSPSGSITPDKERHVSFERLVATIQNNATIQCTEKLLRRLAGILAFRTSEIMSDVSGLMRRLYQKPKAYHQADRYPPRVFLCAYMILSHPEVIFNQRGDREAALTAAAEDMADAFKILLVRLVEPASGDGTTATTSSSAESGQNRLDQEPRPSTAILLAAFDETWVAYLEQFVAWKFADAASLEAELIRAAAGLEKSMLAKVKYVEPDRGLSSDMQAVVEQVAHDHALLRERIQRLGGDQGLVRLEAALNLARAQVSAAAETQRAASATPDDVKAGTTPGGSPIRQSPPLRSPATPGLVPPATPESLRTVGITTNEGMVWELLYDRDWQLPMASIDVLWTDATGETDPMKEPVPSGDNLEEAEELIKLQQRVVRIAERAFWDKFEHSLLDDSQQSAAARLADILGELGSQLADVLPEEAPVATQLRADLERSRIEEALAVGRECKEGESVLEGLDSQHLLSTLSHAAGLLRQLGAPEREAAALQAQANVASRLQSALAARDNTGLAAGITHALRLLTAQLRMLRRDATNFRLRILSRSLVGNPGLNYARDKFVTAWGISQDMPLEELAGLIPLTRGVLALVSGTLPTIEQRIGDPASLGTNPSSNSPAQVPATIRAGLRGLAASAPSISKGPASNLVRPVKIRSWNSLVRLGLVQLISADTPVSPTAVPETLLLDLERLFRLQNEFGRIIVLAACLLVLQQVSRPSEDGLAAADNTAKQRLSVLLADPSIRLPDLAAELSRLAGGDTVDDNTEKTIMAGLNGLIRRSGPGYKALANGIVAALQVSLLSSDPASSAARSAMSAPLARCGASSLCAEVQALSEGLATIAAINEAVHFNIYERLSADLL